VGAGLQQAHQRRVRESRRGHAVHDQRRQRQLQGLRRLLCEVGPFPAPATPRAG
jgi:hypothetical protein